MLNPPVVFDPSGIRDISPDVLDVDGRLRVLPAAYWATTTIDERALFGHRHGIYGFPTTELVDHLQTIIGGRQAIEIGAGNGVLAEALGITATDSRQQEKAPYRQMYARMRQPTVRYGPNVVDCHARRAVRRYQPQVVIGCWVPWKYDPTRHPASGNEDGVDEEDILRHCQLYVNIGHELVHAGSQLWDLPHHVQYPPFVYSRTRSTARDYIGVWPGRLRP